MEDKEIIYDVILIGGGISGSALYYLLSRYTNIKKICLLEKYEDIAILNSNATSNSQTIHCGDIETNYTLEKATSVKKTAKMIEKYCLQYGYEGSIMFKHQKMTIGIGYDESKFIRNRFKEFKNLYPYLELYDKKTLKKIEPLVIYDKNGNERDEEIVGMGTNTEFTTVNFKALSNSFIDNAKKNKNILTDIFFNSKVNKIKKKDEIFNIKTSDNKKYKAKMIIVNAGAHSLYFAHKMGYGLSYGQLPMAGSFYKSNRRLLRGKVYMVQNPKLPFAALHGDPDITLNENTRFGPTALVLPKLERFKKGTYFDFFYTLKLDLNILKIFFGLLKDKSIRDYIFRNIIFEIPYFGKNFFLKDARKIIPSLKKDDIEYAKGFGGVRAQILDKKKKKIVLGELSINTGDGIIFNMTPSPGATSCLGNAYKDLKIICKYLKLELDETKFQNELI